jgi:pSer/pThr/pTyr-binding forkhead associated (FHA) protein
MSLLVLLRLGISQDMSLALNPSSPLNGRSKLALDRLPVVVGRDPDCDVCLLDSSVSRIHCEIDQINGKLVVLDLESKYGTFVNGHRVRFAHLMPGDILYLGRTRLAVEGAGTALRVLPSREGILANGIKPR